MITVSSFKDLLQILKYKNLGDIFEKNYPEYGVSLSVDFKNKKIIYPSCIKGRERNNNFESPENFVVFECVNRLLDKGYRPEHIELEKEWHLGHDSKSGRADICVSNPDGSMLLIIECKTWGNEFNKAWKNTQYDGAQLFSYWQQEQSVKWLVLYASDISNASIQYNAYSINCSDDPNIVFLSKNDDSIKLYKIADSVPKKYDAWNETYGLKYYTNIIFTEESRAYDITVRALFKKDLVEFKPEDKIINKFEEILRHNNVSDKENAFNKLIALFICKLVDESTKSDDDEVDFQYKAGSDTYETLQDRLQRLHCEGVEKYMREKIMYVPADYPEKLFAKYNGANRKKAIEDLQHTIRILKYYSNNDFAFKDVHNEELFYQNGKILVEMVQLFEKYRIIYPSKHQFLGDLFEQLLNNGFKQNEGQFFTPGPITRFIWDCLPLKKIIYSGNKTVYPKIIDYACGAGHFLTEAVEAINHYIKSSENNAWVRDHIYGIEKDYRLARTSKISLFMNGAGEGNIIFADGLDNLREKEIIPGTFDILVANPPFSISSFKQHLKLKDNNLELLKDISSNGSEIELLFVERIAQLLKPKGIAAVILPTQLLYKNTPRSYIGAREIILKNFYIRGIVALGDKTFSKTNSTTNILFLEKYDEPPKQMSLAYDVVNSILSNNSTNNWKDTEILSQYLNQIHLTNQIWSDFITENMSIEELEINEYFKIYVQEFRKSSEYKDIIKPKKFMALSEDAKNNVIKDKLYSFIRNVEAEKIYYFSLIYNQKTFIIQSPKKNDEQIEFLGYTWSDRVGGIDEKNKGGKMYDFNDREKEGTLAHAIRMSFNNNYSPSSENIEKYGHLVNTKDMLDFSREKFNKSISLNPNCSTIDSKFPLEKLETYCEVSKGNLAPQDKKSFENGKHKFFRVSDLAKYHITDNLTDCSDLLNDDAVKEFTLFKKGTILLPASGKSAFLDHRGILGVDGYVASHFATIRSLDESKLLSKYVFILLNVIKTIDIKGDSGYPSLNSDDIENLKIPIPPMPIQEEIIKEYDNCSKVIKKYQENIIENNIKIKDIFLKLNKSEKTFQYKLIDNSLFTIDSGTRVTKDVCLAEGNYPIISANVFDIFGYTNDTPKLDFTTDSIIWGIDDDWKVRYMSKNTPFYPTDHCGVIKCNDDKLINMKYLAHVIEIEGELMGFTREYRPSKDRIVNIVVNLPDIKTQNNIIAKIDKIENDSIVKQNEINALEIKIKDILFKYI